MKKHIGFTLVEMMVALFMGGWCWAGHVHLFGMKVTTRDDDNR